MSKVQFLIAHVWVALAVVPASSAWGQQPIGSLQSAFDEAQRLAAEPAKRDDAAARLRELAAAHRANQELYEKSLKQLVELYRASGREADGIRYFLKLAADENSGKRSDTLGKILQDYHLKQPDMFQQALVELGLVDAPRKRLARELAVAQGDDLARAILQREDKQLRERALETLREQLAPATPHDVKIRALRALATALPARFDRQPFRALVLPLFKSPDERVRMLALSCLAGVTSELDDLSAVAALAEDPSPQVRGVVASTLVGIGGGKAPEVVVPALKKLLADGEPDVVRATIRAQWGQYPEPQLDAQFIALADNPRYHHEAIYFGLSTQRSKSPAVCRRLVDELADPDWNNSGRAAWGLNFGVPPDARSLVEEGMLAALPEETNTYTRGEEFTALEKVASEKSRPYLTKVAGAETESDADREVARRILAKLDAAAK
jgi:hypothetical protein